MRWLAKIGCILMGLVLTWGFTYAQEVPQLPPLPVTELSTRLIFPDEQVYSTIDQEQTMQTYLFPAMAGEEVMLRMERLSGDLVPFMRLRTTSGAVIDEQEAQDLAGKRVAIEYVSPNDAWYLVDVSFDPASESYGTYLLNLSGTTSALYDLLAFGLPPSGERMMYLMRGVDTPLAFEEDTDLLFALNEGEAMTLRVLTGDADAVALTDLEGNPLDVEEDGLSGVLSYTAAEPVWGRLSVLLNDGEPVEMALSITRADVPESTLAPYQLDDLITPSPSPTFTVTPLPSPTPSPTFTLTPSPTPLTCPGTLPSRLNVGDSGRVIPGPSNNMRERATTSASIVTQIPGGGEFVVLEGPVCANNYAWYRVEYNRRVGWTAEANNREYWIEPLDNN